MEIKKLLSFYFLISFLGVHVLTLISNRIMFVINIIVILDKCLFYGCTLPFCWTFYISILGEYIYKLPLKSNAGIVVFFDVLTKRTIYLILKQLFQVEIKLFSFFLNLIFHMQFI